MNDPFLPTSAPPPGSAASGAAMDRRIVAARAQWLRRWKLPALAAVAIVGGVIAVRLVPSAGTLRVVEADTSIGEVRTAPFADYLPVRATVAPLHSVFLDAIEGGQVASVAVLDGAAVHAGQVLATLSNPQLQLDVSSRAAAITGQLGTASADQLALQQSLATERASIAETSYDLLKAQRDLSVRRALQAQGFESDASVKNFADDAQYYAARLAMLRAAYAHDIALAQRQSQQIDNTQRLLRANLDTVQGSLQALTLRAPVAGRLTDFLLQPGQTVRQGDQLGQIDSTDAFRLDADIDEFYLGRIGAGEAAVASFDGTAMPLTVSRVLPQVANGQFRTELTFNGTPPPGLRRGQTMDLRITLGQTTTTLLVPNGPWLNATGGNFIFVVSQDGHAAVRRTIAVGRRNPDQVEIISGLTPGERVITSSYATFQNFSRLLIQ
jgi:HlyD family secretion protein